MNADVEFKAVCIVFEISANTPIFSMQKLVSSLNRSKQHISVGYRENVTQQGMCVWVGMAL